MNKIPQYITSQVQAAFLRNGSLRYAVREFGIAKKTAQRIRSQLVRMMEIPACSCGRPAGHKAICHSRPTSIKQRQPRQPKRVPVPVISINAHSAVVRNGQLVLLHKNYEH